MRKIIATAAAAGLFLAVPPVSAHNLTPTPTSLGELAAEVTETSVEVSGVASFGGQGLLSVGTDPADDFPLPMYDLLSARIAQLDPETGDLTFVLKLRDLPADGSMPEAARYIWDFGIDLGGFEPVALSIEGKFTDVARNQSTRIPNFILRGNCETVDNITTCENIADLPAEMIGSDDEIFVDVPKAILEEQAEESIDDRQLVPVSICEGISVKVSAYFSLCGGDVGTAAGDTIIQDAAVDTYTIAHKKVDVTLTPVEGGSSQTVSATVAEDDSFAASIPTAGLAPGSYRVGATACFGDNCDTGEVLIEV